MIKPILVDTDVMVDYLRGHPKAVTLVKNGAEGIGISSIVIAELYAGMRGEQEQAVLDALFSAFRVISVTGPIARVGGLFKRDFGKSHGVGLPDAIVAATVQIENAELCTLNVKHYPMFKGLKPAYAKP